MRILLRGSCYEEYCYDTLGQKDRILVLDDIL